MFLLAKTVAPAANFSRLFSSPSAAGAFCRKPCTWRAWRTVLEVIVTLAATVPGAGANESDILFPELRVATAYQGKFDVDIYTAAWHVRAPSWSRAHRLELAAGVVRDADDSRPFGFVGPVWRFASRRRISFLDFSLGPTVIGGSTFDGDDLGGNLHFRSALALGFAAGRDRVFEVAFRIEHISNGGLRSNNPGLDSIGVGFVILPEGRAGN